MKILFSFMPGTLYFSAASLALYIYLLGEGTVKKYCRKKLLV